MILFFLSTFLLTWGAWAAAFVIAAPGAAHAPGLAAIREPVFLLGVFAPGIVALTLTARIGGRASVEALLRHIARWRVGVRWYVFAVGYMAAIKLVVAVVYRAGTGEWPRFGETHWAVMVLATLVSTWAQAGEELGWRGYALPRLAARMGLARASLLLGVVWSVWHLPLFFVPAADTFDQSFPLYVAQVTALSVTMAWLYWRTGGSLLLVMVLHAAVNNTKDIVPSAVPGATNPFALSTSATAWLTVGLLWLAAGYFLVHMRGASLSDRHRNGAPVLDPSTGVRSACAGPKASRHDGA